MTRIRSARPAGALAVLGVLLSGCGPDRSLAGRGPEGPGLECVRRGYACTWREVGVDVRRRIDELADRVIALLEADRPVEEIASALRGEPDMAEVQWEEGRIRFRVEEGRAIWVVAAETYRPGIRAAAPVAPTSQAQAVGTQPPGEKPRKAALFLDPYRWEWGDDELLVFHDAFKTVKDYRCGSGASCPCRTLLDGMCIEVVDNSWRAGCNPTSDNCTVRLDVTPKHFADWARFDVVHVASHGLEVCQGTNCSGAIATGRFLSESDFLHPVTPGAASRADPLSAPVEDAYQLVKGIELERVTRSKKCPALTADTEAYQQHRCGESHIYKEYLTGDFFVDVYKTPGALAHTLVFLNVCSSMRNKAIPNALVAAGGGKNVVIGWTQVVGASLAAKAAGYFYGQWITRGKPAKEAFDSLAKEYAFQAPAMLGSELMFRDDDEGTLADARRARPDRVGEPGRRGREVISLLDPRTREEYQDGGILVIRGRPGDRQSDRVEGLLEVAGVAADEDPAAHQLFLRVDRGTPVGPFKLKDRVRPGVYRTRQDIDLGSDLPDRPVDVEIWSDLPGGGTSRWVYEDMRAPVQFWTASVNVGRYPGSFGGWRGEAVLLGNRVVVTLEGDPDQRPSVLVNIHPGDNPLGSAASVEMCQVEIAFSPSGDPVQDVQANRAANVCSGGPSPGFPAAATVEIRRIGSGWVEGWAEGTFYRAHPYPPNPSEQGAVRVDFRMPLCVATVPGGC